MTPEQSCMSNLQYSKQIKEKCLYYILNKNQNFDAIFGNIPPFLIISNVIRHIHFFLHCYNRGGTNAVGMSILPLATNES